MLKHELQKTEIFNFIFFTIARKQGWWVHKQINIIHYMYNLET